MRIPFNKADIPQSAMDAATAALKSGQLAGDGPYGRKCEALLQKQCATKRAFVMNSCSDALVAGFLLAGIGAGDEIIMPSFTFPSMANAAVIPGGVPVFVDMRADTLNIDETLIEAAITPKTKAICVMHYAGVACAMDKITDIAKKHNLMVIEDAAHCSLAYWRDRPLGGIGDLGTLSFHNTKNVPCGEGGALLVNRGDLVARAEILREKGTNRSAFLRHDVSFYNWVDIGGSFLMNDLTAAVLHAQLERAQVMTARRLQIWDRYRAALAPFAEKKQVTLPSIPEHCRHNAHIAWLVLPTPDKARAFMDFMADKGIGVTRHYVPLHSAPAGLKYGRAASGMAVTDDISARLMRLPVSSALQDSEADSVVKALQEFFSATK